jgi:hypothetical protein
LKQNAKFLSAGSIAFHLNSQQEAMEFALHPQHHKAFRNLPTTHVTQDCKLLVQGHATCTLTSASQIIPCFPQAIHADENDDDDGILTYLTYFHNEYQTPRNI